MAKKTYERTYGAGLTERIDIRWSEDQLRAVEEQAESLGLERVRYVRNAALIVSGREDLCDVSPEVVKAIKSGRGKR